MKNKVFEALLALVDELTEEQKVALKEALVSDK